MSVEGDPGHESLWIRIGEALSTGRDLTARKGNEMVIFLGGLL